MWPRSRPSSTPTITTAATTLQGAASRPRTQPHRAQHLDHLARRRATPAAARRHLARSRRSGTRKCRLVRVFGAVSAQHPSQARAARRPLHIPARLCCHQFLVSLEERLPSGTVATGLDIGLALEPGEEVGVAFAQERPRPWVTDPREVASIRRQAAVVSPTRRGGPLVDGRIPSPTGRQPSGSASGSLKSRGACCPS